MTQEQKTKISEHFDELHTIVSDCGLNVPNDIRDALRAAYLAGADYALDIYSPHWASVEDEMPSSIDIVLYCDEDGNYYTETDNIGKDVKITHWMHIPDCPPLQDFNNKLRAVLDGANEEGGEE